MYEQLLKGLTPIGRRLRLRSSVELVARTAWLAFAVAALFLLLSRVLPIENYLVIAAGIIGIWLLAWLGYSVLFKTTPFNVARRADAELSLRDRLATALTLAEPDAHVTGNADAELVARQQEDALAQLRRIEPRTAFPIRTNRRLLIAAVVALAAMVALVLLPNPMDAVIAERREIRQAAQAQAEKLDQLAETIQENQELDEKEKQELLAKLRELAAQLKANPGDAKQALADVAKLQDSLNNRLDLSKSAEAAALGALAAQLAQAADNGETPENADELAKLLEEIAANSESLTEEQRAGITQALQQAASQVAASNPNLASALTDLAQGVASNASSAELQSASAQTAAELQNASEQQALQRAVAQALNQADATQQAVARAANSTQSSNNQTASTNPSNQQGNQGQGQGQGQGEGQGQGAGTGTGQVGSGVIGGGGGGGSGQVGGPNGQNKDFETHESNTVYSPFHVGQGQEEKVGGQDSGSGESTTHTDKSPLPGSVNPALVPYSQVFQQYNEIAGQAMDNSYIPAGLKDYVKEYFSSLEP